jgi:predicted DNA-binding protein
MNLTSPIPVRFGAATAERLKAVSAASGVPVAQLIRLATEHYLRDVEKRQSITVHLKPARRAARQRPPGKP